MRNVAGVGTVSITRAPTRAAICEQVGTYLRSFTLSPAFLSWWPSVWNSCSQDSGFSFVSAERPMALRKSCGVAMLPKSAGRAEL